MQLTRAAASESPRCHGLRFRQALFAALMWCCLAAHGTAQALTLYVSPDGSDAASGLSAASDGRDGPMASLHAALRRMGDLAGKGDDETTDRILLLPGTYTLGSTVVIDSGARGASDKPLVVAAQKIGTVTLTGGMRLPTFKRSGELWQTRAPSSPPIQNLWIGERRAILARAPNHGYFQGGANTSNPVPESPHLRVSKPATVDNTRRLVLAAEAQATLRHLLAQPGGSIAGLDFVALHSWTNSRQHVDAFDTQSGVVTLSPNGRWPFLLFDTDQRYFLENHEALLDAPGEWWAAPDGTVRYVPRPGEVPSDVSGVVPRLETLLAVTGTADTRLRRIVLRGLRFQHANALTTPHVDGQAAPSVPSALVADHIEGLEVDQCAFEHLGGHGLWLRAGVINARVRRNHFRDLGGGGIRIGDTKLSEREADRTMRVVVDDNLIEDGGITFASAVGVWIGHAGDNRIAHNEVRNFNYSGISVGWRWDFGPSGANRNVIEKNHVHDVGRGVLSDLGGIYALGRTDGTVIRNNLIERVVSFRQTGGSTAFGIYLDAGSSDITVEDNVSIGSTGGGFHLHWGRDNTVRNNVFAEGLLAQAKRARRGPDASLRFERNVLVGKSPRQYQGEWTDADVTTQQNVLWSTAEPFESRGQRLSTLQNDGKEAGSVDHDPQLRCDESGCTIATSIAKLIGFKRISLEGVGIRDHGSMLPR